MKSVELDGYTIDVDIPTVMGRYEGEYDPANLITRPQDPVPPFPYDRGVGGSGGNPATATSEDSAYDAYAAFSFLSSQPNIDAEHTGIIGHSEGGIIAPMIAARQPEVDFIELLGAPGIPGKELLLGQSAAILKAAGASKDQIDEAREMNRNIYEVIINEPDNEKAKEKLRSIYKDLGVPEDRMKAEIESLLTPWFRLFLTYDSGADLQNTECPVLAVTGSLDVHAPADENLVAIEEAVSDWILETPQRR